MKADRAIMRTSRRKRYFTAKRMSGWIWGIFRAGIILGIAYVILYPLLVKLSVSLMGDGDMYDMTVKWLLGGMKFPPAQLAKQLVHGMPEKLVQLFTDLHILS